jgi:hypothetical protein
MQASHPCNQVQAKTKEGVIGFLLFVGTITGVVGIGNLITGYITPGIVLTAIGLWAYYWAYTMYKSQQQVGIDFQANLLAIEMQLGHRGTEGGKIMPSPNAELINTLERIGSIKNQL